MWAERQSEFAIRPVGNQWRDFLLQILQKLLEAVPLTVRVRKWYVCDGAPAHFSRAVRDVFSDITFRKRDLFPSSGEVIEIPTLVH